MKQINFDWDHFKCKKCGKCCIGIGLPWPGHCLGEIAKFLKITPAELITKYIGRIVEKDGKKLIYRYGEDEDIRCPFLSSNNLCSIYEVRPDGCRLYPIETDFGRCGIDCPGFD